VGWLIVCALLAGGGSLLALAAFGAADAIDTSPVFIFLLNAAVDFGVVAGAYLSVAVYAHVSGSHDGFQDVFA
jgi:hypothetical protein